MGIRYFLIGLFCLVQTAVIAAMPDGPAQRAIEKSVVLTYEDSARSQQEITLIHLGIIGKRFYYAALYGPIADSNVVYYDKAELFLHRILLVERTRFPHLFLLAGNIRYKRHEDLTGAYDFYKKVIATDTWHADAHLNLGIVCRDMQRYEESIQYIHEYLQLAPDSLPLYKKHLSQTYHAWGRHAGKDLGDLTTAIEKITKAIEIDPTAEHFYEDLSVAYGMMGDYLNAIKTSEAGIRVNPSYAPFYLNIAASYNRMGNMPKSQEYLQKAEMLKEK